MAKDTYIGANQGDNITQMVTQGSSPGKELEIFFDKTVIRKPDLVLMLQKLMDYVIQQPDPK